MIIAVTAGSLAVLASGLTLMDAIPSPKSVDEALRFVSFIAFGYLTWVSGRHRGMRDAQGIHSVQEPRTRPRIVGERHPPPRCPPVRSTVPMRLGQTVIYKLSDHDVEKINKARHARGYDFNDAVAGMECAATVVRAFPECANLQVHLDGPDNLWVCSRSEGKANGQYTLAE